MEKLSSFRDSLNNLDEQIVALIAQRIDICRSVAHYKKDNGIPMMQSARVQQVKERCAGIAEQHNVDPDFMRSLYSMIINETCRVEDEIIQNGR